MEDDPKLGLFVNVSPKAILVGKFYAEWSLVPKDFNAFSALIPVQTFTPITNGTLKDLVSATNMNTGVAK